MTQHVTMPCKGLYIDPNPLAAGARGGLCRADEVIFEKAGTATSRPAFRSKSTKSVDRRPKTIRRFDGVPFVSAVDPDVPEDWYIETAAAVIGFGEEYAPPDTGVSFTQWMEARQSLYYTSAIGVRKIEDGSAVVDYEAGVQVPYNLLFGFGGAGGQLGEAGATWRAAYRYVFVSEDSNGYIRRSSPCPRIDVKKSTNGVGYGLSGKFMLPAGVEAGDKIELYRTKITTPNTVVPSEEYYLALTHVVTSSEASARLSATFQDNTPDDELGVALYTNPGQGGMESTNEIPPRARCLEWHEDCAWFGNTESRHRLMNTVEDAGGNSADAGGNINATGLQMRQGYTGTWLNGATAITGVASVTGLVEGMNVFYATTADGGLTWTGLPGQNGAFFQADTLITSITGVGPYTINISKPTLAASGGAAPVFFCDNVYITRDGTSVGFYSYGSPILYTYTHPEYRGFYPGDSADTYSENIAGVALGLAHAINGYNWANPTTFKIRCDFLDSAQEFSVGSVAGGGTFILESTDVGGSPFTITSSRPDAFREPLTTSGQVSDEARRPNRLYFSKPREPEAVPPLNFIDLGSERHEVYQAVSAGGVLYVFKGDGIFKVTGTYPSWRVDHLTPNGRLLFGGAACAVDTAVAAWTDLGVLVVQDNTVRNISDGRISTILRPRLEYVDADGLTDYPWAAFWPAKNLLLMGWANSVQGFEDTVQSGQFPGAVFCYSVGTGEWSKWTTHLRCAHAEMATGLLSVGYGSSELWDIRVADMLNSGHDQSRTLSSVGTWTVNTLLISSAQRDFWRPKVGDWLQLTTDLGTVWRRIADINYGVEPYLVSWDDALDSDTSSITAVVGYETIETRLQWQAHGLTAKSALYRELFPQLTFRYALTRSTIRIECGAASDIRGTPVVDDRDDLSFDGVKSQPYRFGLNRSVARSTHLYPYLEIGEPGTTWDIHGIAVEFAVTSEKMRR